MEDQLAHNLRLVADAFAKAKRLKLVTVARQAFGDWQFFDRLAAGASFTVRKYDQALAWFSANWPDAADWPEGVARPAVSEPVKAVA